MGIKYIIDLLTTNFGYKKNAGLTFLALHFRDIEQNVSVFWVPFLGILVQCHYPSWQTLAMASQLVVSKYVYEIFSSL